MKSLIPILIVLAGHCLAACGPGSLSTQPPAGTPAALTTAAAMLPTRTLASPTPTHTPTQLPTRPATRTPTQPPTPTPTTPAPIPTSTEGTFADRLLPDLQTLPPADLRLLYDAESGRALIRFTNSVWNSGPGSLELLGARNRTGDHIQVSQRVYAADPEIFNEYEVGEFIFDDEHNHWHFERFALYEVWSVDVRGALESLVSSGEKVSWCVIDEAPLETTSPGETVPAPRGYFHCEGEVQGLSVGWVDIYESYLPRQWVEIAPLQDGRYALVSTVNPDHLLYEAGLQNNTGLVFFEIRGLRLVPLEAR
jgi:hypothetical protein